MWLIYIFSTKYSFLGWMLLPRRHFFFSLSLHSFELTKVEICYESRRDILIFCWDAVLLSISNCMHGICSTKCHSYCIRFDSIRGMYSQFYALVLSDFKDEWSKYFFVFGYCWLIWAQMRRINKWSYRDCFFLTFVKNIYLILLNGSKLIGDLVVFVQIHRKKKNKNCFLGEAIGISNKIYIYF